MIVLGSGIIGLTAGIRLVEMGYRVRIWTAAPWWETVSNVAAAIWYPYRAYPAARVDAWGAHAFRTFAADAADPGSGVRMRAGRVLWSGAGDDAGVESLPTPLKPIPRSETPPAYDRGVRTSLPVIEMPIYLAWLERRFLEMGGEIELRAVGTLDEALAASEVVVNSAGLGAGELAGDGTVYPIRGQVVRVENAGIERFTLDAGGHAEEITYVIPRSADVVLGGTAAERSWDTTPDDHTAGRILERCVALEPALRGARVLGHAVGLRPGRPSVRLEREHRRRGMVIHNYGHGGSGVTVCWGCAEEVVRLAGGS